MATPTTTLALDTAFRAAIEDIAPRFEHERVSTWRYTPGPRERGTALHLHATELRSFDLVWGVGAESRNWYGNGAAYVTSLKIVTSYSSVPVELIDHMISDDAVDLTRMFMRLTEPTVPGFAYAVQRPGNKLTDDNANLVYEHVYDIHWSQQTA